MATPLKAESTLTGCYETRAPRTVGGALKLGKRNMIHTTIRPDGEVVLGRAEPAGEENLLIGQFLGGLSRDIASHPERLQALDARFVQGLQSLVGGIEVDLDFALSVDHA